MPFLDAASDPASNQPDQPAANVQPRLIMHKFAGIPFLIRDDILALINQREETSTWGFTDCNIQFPGLVYCRLKPEDFTNLRFHLQCEEWCNKIRLTPVRRLILY